MGGQVLGGGVIVLVAVVLWLVYLLPSWYGRHQFDAAERNALRLNRALRVLAETSETPEEVRLELTARTALAQQRLARQAQSERENLDLERARAELAVARLNAKADAAQARERAAVAARIAWSRPELRRARARRRARLTVSVVGALAAALAVWGGVEFFVAGTLLLLVPGIAVMMGCLVVLRRLSVVQRRTEVRAGATHDARVASELQDVALASDRVGWTPRELPRPLTVSAGSRAAVVLDQADAQAALRRAATEEAMRARAAGQRPPSIETARAGRLVGSAAATAGAGAFAGAFDGGPGAGDEVIEAHVRRLLERRASGQ